MYDYLIVGSGLFGAVFAYEAKKRGKKCLVIERRNHIGGNVYTERLENIDVHCYGAHIFHTSNQKIWDYVNAITPFRPFVNSPIANYHGEIYNLPFNMNTFHQLWGVVTPEEAQQKVAEQVAAEGIYNPKNLEEQAIKLVGRDVYEKLIKEYTEKQWGRPCCELPAFIIKRLPLRFTYDNNYFNDRWQGIPEHGYTALVEGLLQGIELLMGTDYFDFRAAHPDISEKTVYTGMIDEYFGYRYGRLAFRSLRFDTERLETENFQGNAVVNYTSHDVAYTRIMEHKHFSKAESSVTYITKEYPFEWKPGDEPFYPVNDERNSALYRKYEALAMQEDNVIFGGRLGSYKYYDMDQVIAAALDAARAEFA